MSSFSAALCFVLPGVLTTKQDTPLCNVPVSDPPSCNTMLEALRSSSSVTPVKHTISWPSCAMATWFVSFPFPGNEACFTVRISNLNFRTQWPSFATNVQDSFGIQTKYRTTTHYCFIVACLLSELEQLVVNTNHHCLLVQTNDSQPGSCSGSPLTVSSKGTPFERVFELIKDRFPLLAVDVP